MVLAFLNSLLAYSVGPRYLEDQRMDCGDFIVFAVIIAAISYIAKVLRN